MLCDVTAEIRQRRETHDFGYLGNRQFRIIEKFFYNGNSVEAHVKRYAVACYSLDGFGQIFWRDAQLLCIICHLAVLSAIAFFKHFHKSLHHIRLAVGSRFRVVNERMEIIYIVNHGHGKAPDYFGIERMAGVGSPFHQIGKIL